MNYGIYNSIFFYILEHYFTVELTMNYSLGAAIIVRNEEANILNCLNSIKSVCSQIVVVDTGSDDNTTLLASKMGVDLYFHKWKNDFSDARNFAIKHLHTDWIISIDADEELVQKGFASTFEKIISSSNFSSHKIGGISVVLNNFLAENLETSKQHRFTRIFRNDKRIKFAGKIHEQVADSIYSAGFEIIDSDIIFNHYGYIGKNIEKKNRNKVLLEEAINQNSDDVFLCYHLATTEFAIGNYDKALELYLKILHSSQLSSTQKEEAKLKIAQIFLNKNEFEQALKILDFTANNIDNEGLRLSILGISYLSLRDFAKAKEIYNNPAIEQSKLVDKTILENSRKIFEIIGMVD